MTTYHPEFTQEEKDNADELFRLIEGKTKNTELTEVPLVVPSIGTVVWACIWNESKAIGRKVAILASTGKLCLAAFYDTEELEYPHNIYRNEDIAPYISKKEHEKASELVRSLGLPTFEYIEP